MAEEKNKPTICCNSNTHPLTRQTNDSIGYDIKAVTSGPEEDPAPNLYKHTTWPLHPDNALLDDGSIIGLDLCVCEAETSDDESCDACRGGLSSRKDENEKFAKLWRRFGTKPGPSAKYQKKNVNMEPDKTTV